MTTVEPTTEIEPTAEPGQGVEISIRVEASGYEPIQTYMATEDYEPSSVEVSGYVRDQEGQAIPGATVTIGLADGEVSETTDSNGFYRIYVETEGTQPLVAPRDWELAIIPTAGNIQIEIPEIIWVPGETPLTITALDPAGKPLNKSTAIITVVDFNNKPIPFLTVSEESGRWPDENGKLSTEIITRDPTDSIGDYVYAKEVPLKAKIQVEIKDRERTVSYGQAETIRPFNLARIHGVTVGPDMEPRAEWEAPTVNNVSKTMVLWRDMDTKGNFWVVVKPLHPQEKIKPKAQWILAWDFGDHLPLQYPLKTPPEPGEEMDVGKIDILTPEEHEARLTQIVGEFLIAMPLKPDARRGVWDNLYALTFAVDTSKDVPFYRDNALDSSGTVYYPDKPEDYWSQNLLEGNDPAYVIISHELGHFLHHALIERHALRHFCYKFGVGLGHKTWQPPDLTIKKVDLAPQAAKEYTSSAESNADFFASLLIPFWLKHHPEMAESIYLQDLGYLAEFDTDEKAMAVVSAGTPGFIVEGVQTRFLRALYARYLDDRPEWAYADYLATMWLYMEKPEHWTPSFLTRPARTITEWAQTKARLGSPIGLSTGDVLGLAEKYKVLKPPEPSRGIVKCCGLARHQRRVSKEWA